MINRLLFSLALALFICAFAFHPPAAFAQVAAIAPAASFDFSALLNRVGGFLVTTGAVGYAVTILTAILPKATGPGPWAFVRGVLDLIAANFGNSANAK
jgi:hypothetical protein